MADISHTTGNVGIGTSSPITKLHISGLGNSTTLTGTGASGGLHFTQNASNDSYVGFTTSGGTTSTTTTQGGILIQGSGAYGTKIHFLTTDAYVDGMKHRMTLDPTGNLGIGTVSPTAKLDVVGDIKALSGITATGLTASGKASVKNIKITDGPVYPALNSATSGFRYGISAGPYNATSYGTNPAQAYNVSYMRIGRLVVVNGVVKTNSQLAAPGVLLAGLPKPNRYHLFHSGSPGAVPSSGGISGPPGDTYRFDIDESGTMLLQASTALPANNWFSVHCKYFTAADEQ